MNKTLLTLIFGFLLNGATAQDVVKFNSPISPSPTAASLGKYGDIPVSTYTGIPAIQIPLYEIKVGSNKLPIALSYYAGGIKVADEASSIGLGWSLNAGGVITRTKKMKDDLSSTGYYKNSVHTNNDGTDKEPDIFYFNFASFSGKFLIDYAANPAQPYQIKRIGIYNDDDLKIILNPNQTWSVIDKYGVRYDFNATENQNDRSVPEGDNPSPIEVSDYISSWFLSKITYTNGEEIIFNYTPGAGIENIPVVDQVFGVGQGYVYSIPSNCYVPPMPRNSLSKTTYNVKTNTIDLTEIIFPGGKIELLYLSDRIDQRAISGMAKRLTGLKIYNSLQTGFSLLKSFSFDHGYFSSSNNSNYLSKRLKLDRVSELSSIDNASNEHILVYAGPNLPDKDSKDIDHWGYYNGPKNNTSLFPASSGTFNITGNSRNPDPDYVKANMLYRIEYPTKLHTQFNFEINDFSNLGTSLFWSSANGTNNGMIGGGVRIKAIYNSDFMNSTLSSRKDFEYLSSNGTQSSGKIMSKINYWAPYDIAFTVNLQGSCSVWNGNMVREIGKTVYTSSSIPISGDAQGNIIGYDRVVIKNVGNMEINKTVDEYHNYSLASLDLYPRLPQVNNNSNGLLKSRIDYVDIGGGTEVPLKQTEISYTTKSSNIVKGYVYTTGWRVNSMNLLSYDILNEWIVASAITHRTFEANLNNVNIGKTVNLVFDNTNKQKTQESYTDSKGDIYTLKYLYPRDLVALGQTEPYQEMENRNMTGFVVQTEKYKNSVLLEKTYSDYARNWPSNANLILPSSTRTQYMSKPVENRLVYNTYDKKGNIQTVSYPNGIKTTYLWSFGYQHPIAEIKNSDYESVSAILGAATIDNFAALLNPNKIAVDNFIAPLKTGLPNAQIATYVYSPLIGLVNHTDVKGQSVYYEYDGFQRLQVIKDQNGHIIKTYKYNYSTPGPHVYYSAMMSQNFNKVCSSGQTGSTVNYVVMPHIYTSIISQADADQKAIDDIALNGQNYANANGLCTSTNTATINYNFASGREFNVYMYNTTTDQSFYYLLSGEGMLEGLPEGTYYITINEISYNGLYNFYIDSFMENGVYVHFSSVPLSSTHYIYVQEL